MSLRQKIGFLLFTGFYVAQAAMLAYVVLVFLALPLLVSTRWTAQWWAFGLGTAVPIAIFLPVAAYLRTEGRRLPFFRTLACCAAAYGSTDLWTMLGLARGFRRGERRWIPTNSVLGRGGRGDWWRDWAHFLFGASFLLVPLWRQPQLLLFPLTWVFAAKYLFVPAVAAHYAGIKAAPRWTPMRPLRWAQALTVWALLAGGVAAIILAPTVLGRHSSSPARVELRDGSICVDGQPTIIRGIHYSPWRPGTGPGKGFDYPSDAEIAADFSLIHSLHANTVLVYDPPARLLDLAQRQNLQVICVFHIQWWRLASGQGELIANEIIEQVQQLQAKPSVLAWMLGNEIPGWVIDKLQPQAVREFLSSTRTRIRAVDLSHPVCHGNWPLARTFDLDRDMDLLCYNVYPFYPTEVIASGYGRFIEREIKPQAHGRPLLITEFGTNTTEVPAAEQGEVLKRCWRDLLSAGCQGGVVFEFADEWWKNYDNPVSPPDWWRRQDAPDDHLTEDADPEEHYGIVTAQREPKPAFATVQEMFAGAVGASRSSAQSSLWWIGSGAAFLLIGAALWMRWKMPHAVHPQGGVVSGGTP